jgi:hypothetical protein
MDGPNNNPFRASPKEPVSAEPRHSLASHLAQSLQTPAYFSPLTSDGEIALRHREKKVALNLDTDSTEQSTPNMSEDGQREDDDVVVPRDEDMFARLMISDANIAPRPFSGTSSDTEKAEQWLASFKTYAKLRALSPAAQKHYFQLLMVDDAATWVRTLPAPISGNLKQLFGEFTKRFSLTDLDRWKKASMLWTREQSADESVDKYVSDLRNAARIIPITDNAMLQFAIIRGLRSDIKLHVLQSSPTSIDDVIQAARVAETALAASRPAQSEVGALRLQIAELMAKLEAKPTVAVIDDTNPARRVAFALDDTGAQQRNQWNRSSSAERTTDHFNDGRFDNVNGRRPGPAQGAATQWAENTMDQRRQPTYGAQRGGTYRGQFSPRRAEYRRGFNRPTMSAQRSMGNSYSYGNNQSDYNAITCFACGFTGHRASQCRVQYSPRFAQNPQRRA